MTGDLPATAGPARSQSTSIEQTRAAEQVRVAMYVAQANRRNPVRALGDVEELCAMREIADRAFYRYPRGSDENGKPVTVTGPTIHLATAVALAWGNLDYGIVELDRDDEAGRSEMLAYAWDLQSNTRVEAGFLVPHARDRRKGGRQTLTELRDIYENNTNNGSRRLRECLWRVMPPIVRIKAEAVARRTIEHGGGVPLVDRIRNALAAFRELGIGEDELGRRMRKPPGEWNAYDVADLTVIFGSLKRGETTREEEFPAETEPVDAQAIAEGNRRGIERAMFQGLGKFGLADDKRRDDRLALLSELVDRRITTSSELSDDEARMVRDTVSQWLPRDSRRKPDEDAQLKVGELITRGRERFAAADTEGSEDG